MNALHTFKNQYLQAFKQTMKRKCRKTPVNIPALFWVGTINLIAWNNLVSWHGQLPSKHLPKSFCHWPARTSPPIFARPWLHGKGLGTREGSGNQENVAPSLTNLDVLFKYNVLTFNVFSEDSRYYLSATSTCVRVHMCIKHIKTSRSDASSDLAPLLHLSWWLDWVSSPPWPYLALPWLLQQRSIWICGISLNGKLLFVLGWKKTAPNSLLAKAKSSK